MLVYAVKCFYPNIVATIWAILANKLVPEVPNAGTRAEQFIELQDAIEQCWKEVTATQ